MKRVKGYFSIKPIKADKFDFYVTDDTTDEQIKQILNDRCEVNTKAFLHYVVKDGYKKLHKVKYTKQKTHPLKKWWK